MRILALDLGKYKSVACDYEAETGRHGFTTILTNPKALHDLIVDREPDRVVIEICSIAVGWLTWCAIWASNWKWPIRLTSAGAGGTSNRRMIGAML